MNSDTKTWSENAGPLAAWAMCRLVNREDCRGGYWTRGDKINRTTRKAGQPYWSHTPEALRCHFAATAPEAIVGLHTTSPENTSRWLAIDIDAHDGEDPAANLSAALAIAAEFRRRGFMAYIFDSDGRGGLHLWVIFSEPVPTASLFRLAQLCIADWRELGLPTKPETFPKQPVIASNGFGNWIRIPGRHHRREHWSRVWLGNRWGTADETITAILGIDGDAPRGLPEPIIDEATASRPRKPRGAWMQEATQGCYARLTMDGLNDACCLTVAQVGGNITPENCEFDPDDI